MADHGRTTRKIRQGKVDIDYEECSLVVHYDLELVRYHITTQPVSLPLCALWSHHTMMYNIMVRCSAVESEIFYRKQ